jgi:hypothetical protein
MAQPDATVEYSKALCKDSIALRAASKVTITEAKEALARSRRIQARVLKRRKVEKS